VSDADGDGTKDGGRDSNEDVKRAEVKDVARVRDEEHLGTR
jgi:hypothetical protein